MSPVISLIADVLVAALLIMTIATSVTLARRIERLKGDEAAMRQTIGELMAATDTAERAIAGLKLTLGDCDRTLAERLHTAERYAADLAEQVSAGQEVMARIGQIVEASRKVAAVEPAVPAANEAAVKISSAADLAAAISERALRRLEGQAA